MDIPGESEKTPWRAYLQQWLRDPNFYRDIVTRTVSGILVALVAFFGLVFAGFINRSDHFIEVIKAFVLLGSGSGLARHMPNTFRISVRTPVTL